MQNLSRVILSFAFLFLVSCSSDPVSDSDAAPDSNQADTLGENDVADASDAANEADGANCERVVGYSYDAVQNCLISTTPDRDFGCRCNMSECDGLTAIGCFISPENDAIVFTPTIMEPDALEQMGWTVCAENPGSIDDIPACN